MDEELLLTSIAELVQKDGSSYVETYKTTLGEGEEFDTAKFLETFKTDLRTKAKTERESQYKRGQIEITEKVNDSLKGYLPSLEIDTSNPLESLNRFNAYQLQQLEAASVVPPASIDDLDEETVKNHPAYQSAWQKQKADAEIAYQAALKSITEKAEAKERAATELMTSLSANDMSRSIQRSLEAGIREMNIAVIDQRKDPVGYSKQIAAFSSLSAFEPHNWRKDESGELFPVDNEGNRRKDKDFHDMNFLDVLAEANFMPIAKHDPENGSPSPTTQGRNGNKKMSREEYLAKRKTLKPGIHDKEIADLAKLYAA